MYGYNGKSVGYFPSFWGFYFCANWLVYACMVAFMADILKGRTVQIYKVPLHALTSSRIIVYSHVNTLSLSSRSINRTLIDSREGRITPGCSICQLQV